MAACGCSFDFAIATVAAADRLRSVKYVHQICDCPFFVHRKPNESLKKMKSRSGLIPAPLFMVNYIEVSIFRPGLNLRLVTAGGMSVGACQSAAEVSDL
jgi:hypothetical protein